MKTRTGVILAHVPALLMLLAPEAHGWMNPLTEKSLPKPATTATTTTNAWQNAAAVAAVAAALVASPMAVNAASSVDFTGSYSDPFHPNCQRVISKSSSASATTTVTIRGTDGNPGCPADGSGTPWTLTGLIDDKEQSIVVDFTPKGGPPNLKGVWDADKSSSSPPGIQWPDGNKWTKIG